ncbi:unnamed protein product [Rotaria sordida]|uniref:Uncharacterized protein n=1 Tax=Rotaria sordida TaxID=392033 RepID=A0A815X783_9BILA|nr:unnamed protein product [Rotaria sordida]CAF1552458.1 unnamed protein product [Rotaria sordida]CAF4155081.1 unnamed protein product [Rotaria sordida]
MSKYAKKKRSIPHEASSESLHKYFKPLNGISDQIISPSSETQPVHVNDISTNGPSQLSFSLNNTSSLVDNISRLSIDKREITLCNSFKNISTTNADSISSIEPIQSATLLQSNISVQSSNTSLLHQNNIKESTPLDVPHKEFVGKIHAFIVQLKTIVDSLDTSCREQIEIINAQLFNIEFVSPKSNDTTSRDPDE